MDTKKLKKALKPIIRECVQEVILEEGGIISHIIKEALAGTTSILFEQQAQMAVTPQRVTVPRPATDRMFVEQTQQVLGKTQKQETSTLEDTKRKLLESIKSDGSEGSDAYSDFNFFEGTTPLKGGGMQGPIRPPSSP